MSEQEKLYNKYNISKTDGSPIDPNAKYIILRYDANSKDFGPSQAAIKIYAEQIKHSNPKFALDLIKELDKEYLKRLLINTAN